VIDLPITRVYLYSALFPVFSELSRDNTILSSINAEFQILSSFSKRSLSEQSSYSAMLNIAESVPPPEPVPSNSRNSIVIQYNRPYSSLTEFRQFPEFQESLPIPESDGIPGIASDSGIERNS
jgi:hypothetical protein